MTTIADPLSANDPLAIDLRAAIHTGDLPALQRLLEANPDLVRAWIAKPDGGAQTPVLIAVDWPGHFPNVAQTIGALVAAGADVNVHYPSHPRDPNCKETPLHQAASSNDVAAIDVLVDAGANVNAPGA